MPIVEMCLRNSFYLQHGKCILCLCCKTRGKVVSMETKWSYEKVEKGSACRRTCEGLCSP